MKKFIPIIFIIIVIIVIIFSLFWLRSSGGNQGNGAGSVSGVPVAGVNESVTGTSAAVSVEAGNAVGDKTITPGANQITLKILSPADGAVVTKPSLTVKGITVPGADVFVNDTQSNADANGNFAITIQLDDDDNYVVVTANDQDGNVAEQEMTVTYNSPQ